VQRRPLAASAPARAAAAPGIGRSSTERARARSVLGGTEVRGGTLHGMEGTPNTESRGSSFLMKALAVAVLLVVAWIAIKVIIGIVASVFWIVLAIVVVLAAIWAVTTLRS
ncbi:MAG: hypothetical protein ACJ76M_04990, partial [Solirubrobacteraceae bacterium]